MRQFSPALERKTSGWRVRITQLRSTARARVQATENTTEAPGQLGVTPHLSGSILVLPYTIRRGSSLRLLPWGHGGNSAHTTHPITQAQLNHHCIFQTPPWPQSEGPQQPPYCATRDQSFYSKKVILTKTRMNYSNLSFSSFTSFFPFRSFPK